MEEDENRPRFLSCAAFDVFTLICCALASARFRHVYGQHAVGLIGFNPVSTLV